MLPQKANSAADIRSLLEKSRKQMEMALPKHLSADRLLRVAMTSIQRTPKLMECTPQSLLACVMTCAQLGLEPDQFLGQAYLVPFKDTRKGVTICTLIPGYRGYIALARRSGELQSVSAQVVYERDDFSLVYGVEDKLEHRPYLGGDRGKPIGAYCVFKFKDGGYSFDFLPTDDIDKVRSRSKASNDGPWVTDWAEMAKKTVIKRHAKLAPLSVEFQKAVALEDRAMSGESQEDILSLNDNGIIEATPETNPIDTNTAFAAMIPEGTDHETLNRFLELTAAANKSTTLEVEAEALKNPKAFWKVFGAWVKQQKAFASNGKQQPDDHPVPVMAPAECPDRPGDTMTLAFCDGCASRNGCPAWG